jgi:hypothetical protein
MFQSELELLKVVQTLDLLRAAFRLAQRLATGARQNRDDGDDDEQFDQGESGARTSRNAGGNARVTRLFSW